MSIAVPSPCINVCLMNEESGLCEGCLRTLDEIAVWGLLDEEEKQGVWTALAARREGAATATPVAVIGSPVGRDKAA